MRVLPGDLSTLVSSIQNAGALGFVIADSRSGNGTIHESATFASCTIPGVSVAGVDGSAIEALDGESVTVTRVTGTDYALKTGTSMACPHVAAVAALLQASRASTSSFLAPAALRIALRRGAVDIGTPGRDAQFGFGLVNARNSLAASVCPADVNIDGDLTPDDLADFIAWYYATPTDPRADFNLDEQVDPDDLSDSISAYYAGC
ncbi:MAG: S8 family serine peptidase [Phycisphaerae bacterium]|nr:S8 family serine peptidase [Phycisphaerae bacterium]